MLFISIWKEVTPESLGTKLGGWTLFYPEVIVNGLVSPRISLALLVHKNCTAAPVLVFFSAQAITFSLNAVLNERFFPTCVVVSCAVAIVISTSPVTRGMAMVYNYHITRGGCGYYLRVDAQKKQSYGYYSGWVLFDVLVLFKKCWYYSRSAGTIQEVLVLLEVVLYYWKKCPGTLQEVLVLLKRCSYYMYLRKCWYCAIQEMLYILLEEVLVNTVTIPEVLLFEEVLVNTVTIQEVLLFEEVLVLVLSKKCSYYWSTILGSVGTIYREETVHQCSSKQKLY